MGEQTGTFCQIFRRCIDDCNIPCTQQGLPTKAGDGFRFPSYRKDKEVCLFPQVESPQRDTIER